MSESGKPERRRFLKATAAAVVCGPLVSCRGGQEGTWRSFTAEEAATVEAICEQLIPAERDEDGVVIPGASRAGVVRFIDRQLAGFYASHRETYRVGLRAVDEASRDLFSARFVDIDAASQHRLLGLLEAGEAPGEGWERVSSRDFFRLILRHTQQGFYGDPRHGGNRDGVAWRMLGVPYPPVRGRNRYGST